MQIRIVMKGIVLAGLVAGAGCNAQEASHAQETFHLCANAVALPFSGAYLSLFDGGEFTFHRIAGDRLPSSSTGSGALMRYDVEGNLIALHDGKRKPLVLGSMPRSAKYVAQLREKFDLDATARIAVHSLNRPYELAWTGAASMADGNEKVTLLMHPTTDECAPSLPDLLRIVRDLRMRDESEHDLSYVHCLAGRSRSATCVAAYILCLLKQNDSVPAVDVVEQYLQRIRPQVRISKFQKQRLNELRRMLLTKDFEELHAEHADAIEARDRECAYTCMASVLRERIDVCTTIKGGIFLAATGVIAVLYNIYQTTVCES